MVGENGIFYYRYKSVNLEQVSLPEQENKDVTAFYTGGVGFEFSELLPLKPEWQDDTWFVLPGSPLPDGITFNSATRKFEGTPTTPGLDTTVQLEGIDALGNTVAKAEAHFDIYTIQGVPVHADIYAHTGKFKVDEMKVQAGVVIDSWQHIYPLPSGISANGPYIQGTPTKADQKRYMLFGKNYMGEVVATYWGNYIVEDGPTFNRPIDWTDIRDLPVNSGVQFSVTVPGKIFATHTINPAKPMRYYLEIDKTEGLPTGVAVQNQTANGFALWGWVFKPFDTGKIRVKAIDSDGTEGYSGWLTFGTGQPILGCNADHPFDLNTGTAVSMAPPKPLNSSGQISYSLVSGAFPDGLKLDNNLIVGNPTKANQQTKVTISSTVTINGNVGTPQSCELMFRTWPGGLVLADATAQQDRHVRVGKTFAGIAEVQGGQNPYEVKAANGSLPAGFSFTTSTADTAQVGVSGTVTAAGDATIPLTLSNGDGNEIAGQLSYVGHGPLDTGTVPTITVQRLGPVKAWGSIPYDTASVIPDVSGAKTYPEFTISDPQTLPVGIGIEDGDFYGATASAAKSYGTHTVTMTDYEGKPVTSNPFEIVVTPRDEIAVASLVDPQFTVRWGEQKATPLVVKQPDGAKNFRVDYVLNNKSADPLPSWLSFDPATGEMTAAAQIAYDDMHRWGPYTITATDEDGSTVTTDEFHIQVVDWPAPDSMVSTTFKGTVTGNTSIGESATWLNIPGTASNTLRNYVLRDTVIGGPEKVTFVGSNPSKPAGLDFNAADGTFSGVPTSEYNGVVEVTFKDEAGREGVMHVPLEVRAYPTVKTSESAYDVPRLANAALIGVPVQGETVSGFWNKPYWTVDTSKGPDLPAGLTLNRETGTVEGQATAPLDTVVSGIVFKATSIGGAGESLDSWTAPFSIKITKPAPVTLAYNVAKATYYLVQDANGKYVVSPTHGTAAPTPIVGGSYEKPLEYSIDTSDAVANGMTGTIDVNKTTGRVTGAPDKLGEWTVKLNVKDVGNRSPEQPATLVIKATLDGFVKRNNGDNALKLRQDERFVTDPIDVSNYVGNVVFSTNPAIVHDGLDLDTDTGAWLPSSHFTVPTDYYAFYIGVRDADGRGFEENAFQQFTVVAPMTASAVTSDLSAKQYAVAGNGGIDASWSVSTGNVIKAVRYSLQGDVPGTLVYKTYDENKVFLGWGWKDEDGNSKWIDANDPNASSLLPYDALVFDTLKPSLVGSPSKSGSFGGLYVVARDLHADDYAIPSPNQAEYNSVKLGPFAIDVEEAASFQAVASAASETIYRYTTTPTISVNAVNAAAGRPVTWSLISGTLPDGVTQVKGDTSASFTGYATEKGNFPGLVWRARDAAGRTATASAQALVIEERKGLELSAKPNPFGVVEGTTLPAFAVNPLNSAFGKSIPASDWTIPTAGLPSGLSMSVANGRVVLSGTTSEVGDYSVPVSATDSLGSVASTQVAISVLDEDEKIDVSSTSGRTKKDFPVQVQIKADSRTFGDMGYLSSDPSVSVDATGLATAIYSTAGHMNPVVTVSDSTRRATDHALSIDVIDALKIDVPTVYAETDKEHITPITASNILGTVTYSKGSGNWPDGLTVDPLTGAIGGVITAAKGTSFTGLTIRGSDAFVVAGTTFHDEQESNAFDVVVDGAPTGFALLTPASPATVSAIVVNKAIEDFAITPINQAWNLPIQQASWSVNTTGAALPPGVTFGWDNGKIVATGTPTQLGTFGPYSFTATDGFGQTATASVSIRVITPDDAIVLNVSDVVTKVGLPISMQSTSDNTYGKVTFYSYAIDGDPQTHVPGEFKGNLAIDASTGLVTGSFPTIGDKTFDVYVSDATKRVTSKPVKVSVLPNLRVVVPDIVTVDPYEDVNRTVDTAYALGTVKYIKGAGNWPDGFTVDATTGAIKATAPLAVGLGMYGGLTIQATDTFATGTETRDSNVFAINVDASGPYVRMMPGTPTAATKRLAYTFDFSTFAEVKNAGVTDLSFKWVADSGTLPAGLTMASNGVVTGTPVNSGTVMVKVTATNKVNSKIASSAVYQLDIGLPAINMVMSTAVKDADRWVAYSYDLADLMTLTNIPKTGLTYTVSFKDATQRLPLGMSVSGGFLTGTPREPGQFSFHLKADFKENNTQTEAKSTEQDVTIFVKRPTSSGFTQISVGSNHVCGVRAGEVWCWGGGTDGQLGNGVKANSNVPVRAGSFTNAVMVAAGINSTCTVLDNGELWCWGDNSNGQLGDTTTTDRVTPVRIMTSGVTFVAMTDISQSPGGASTCAIRAGLAYCWGMGTYGQLGTGSNASTSTPTAVQGLGSGVASIGMEYISTHAAKSDGSLYTWGWGGEGRLCRGVTGTKYPTAGIVSSVTGSNAAVEAYGYAYKTVSGMYAGCQNGPVATVMAIKDGTRGGGQGCLIGTDGKAYCGSTYALVTNAENMEKIDAGNGTVCTIDAWGEAGCWGTGTVGQIGNGSSSSTASYLPIKRSW
jgi:alpha-tubulin suppressor-like RCC1 family protein